MSNVVTDALNVFFKFRDEFIRNKLENKRNFIEFLDEESVDLMPIVKINGKKMKHNLIAVVDLKTKNFIWSWHLNIPKRHCIKSKQLLINYLNKDVETLNEAFIKRIITTSNINNIDNHTLILSISLALYLSKADSMMTTEALENDSISFYGLYEIEN